MLRLFRRSENRRALAQKISQHGIDKPARMRMTERRRAPHRMIDDRIGRGARMFQLIQRNQQQPAQVCVLHRFVQQSGKHAIELKTEAQRAIAQIADGAELLRRQFRMPRPLFGKRHVKVAARAHCRHGCASDLLDFKHGWSSAR